ncbi:MAG: putative cation transporter [Cyanobacteria bacterium RYN_339]|nr:putative cation transporter [Cyanobacteria bacterium RYN_339]
MSAHGEVRGIELWELWAPGIAAALVSLDAGGLLACSLAGARFGPWMALAVPPLILAGVLVHELAARLGSVTGKGTSDLIRERFGVRWTSAILGALWLVSIGTMLAQFVGVAAAGEVFGIPRFVGVPIAAAIIWLVPLRADRTWLERGLLAACLAFVVYLLAVVVAGFAAVVPRPGPQPGWIGYPGMGLALVGALLAPWTQFYLQGAMVDRQIQARDLGLARRGVIAGAVVLGLVAMAIILTCAAGLFVPGVRLGAAADAALALAPLAGPFAAPLFAVVLLIASCHAALVLPVVTAAALCDGLGFASGTEESFAEAPVFYVAYAATIVVGAALALLPWPRLLPVMIGVEVANGVLVPGMLVVLALLASRRRLLGAHAIGTRLGAAVWGIAGFVALLALVALIATVS